MKIAWNIFCALVYVILAIGILSVAEGHFQTLVLAGLIELYTAVLYNFSLLGNVTDINNRAAFLRFRILAEAQGITKDEHGAFADQDAALVAEMDGHRTQILIARISQGIVSIIATLVIIHTIWVSM